MSKSSKTSFNTNETISLPPETFYSCNAQDFYEDETYIIKSKSEKGANDDNKKEQSKPRVNNSFNSFTFTKDIKEVHNNKVDEFWTNYNKTIYTKNSKKEMNETVYDIENVSDLELNSDY